MDRQADRIIFDLDEQQHYHCAPNEPVQDALQMASDYLSLADERQEEVSNAFGPDEFVDLTKFHAAMNEAIELRIFSNRIMLLCVPEIVQHIIDTR